MENENQIKFYFGIIAVMLAFVIIVGGFILIAVRYQKRLYFKQQELFRLDAAHKKELLLSSIESAEAERMQLAKDIHDEIGSIFSTLSLSINQLNTASPQENHITISKNLIQAGIDSVRRISHSLIPLELELLGLEQTIEGFLNTIETVSNIKINFVNTAPIDTLNTAASLAIYRIVQELSSNCIKYANAKNINLTIQTVEENLLINYNDDGMGVEMAKTKNKKGIGLRNIESRVLLMNGTVTFLSQPNEGFSCQVVVPLYKNTSV